MSPEPSDQGRVRVLLSGGPDSAACVGFYREKGLDVEALFVRYGQASAKREAEAAEAVAQHYSLDLKTAVWSTSTTHGDGVIAGRNAFLIFAALMEGGDTPYSIGLGVHSGTGYPDCSRSFVDAAQAVLDYYGNGRVVLGTPFLSWTKKEIWRFARQRNVPLDLTWSCEASVDVACGKCLSCRDRETLNA